MHSYAIVRVLFLCYDFGMENKVIMSRDPSYFDSYDNECFCPEYECEVKGNVGEIQPESKEKGSWRLHR
jgi:hypothetical protein